MSKLAIVQGVFAAIAAASTNPQPPLVSNIYEVEGDESTPVKGTRLIMPLHPTMQFMHMEEQPDVVAVFAFPADDAAVVAQTTLEVANALRKADPAIETVMASVVAPKFVSGGIQFVSDIDEVYAINDEILTSRYSAPVTQESAAPEAPANDVAG